MGKSTQELKYKRLKVGHACFICRSKKIKCDGLRPCMQCKARGRQCQSGNSDITTTENPESQGSDNSSTNESDDETILFARRQPSLEATTATTTTTTSRRSTAAAAATTTATASKSRIINESWTSNMIERATQGFKKGKGSQQAFPGYATFGSFVKWIPEPSLPSHYAYPIEMPSGELQMRMLEKFFSTRYMITPVIPKKYFFDQLKIKGPLITPLLLNAIYCAVSARCPELNAPKSVVFFNRARKMLDDFLDVPRISTVVALGLLSLYEPEPVKGKVVDQHCRSWMYSGMCFRMCLELGLNIDSEFARKTMAAEEVELRRRVFWFCYCLDKLQSIEWERLWILPASLAKVSLPQALPDDDDDEKYHVQFLKDKINISMIAEEGIQIRAMFSVSGSSDPTLFYQQLENYRTKALNWKKQSVNPYPNIPAEECKTIEEVMSLSIESPNISHLFTIYYFILTDTLFCLPESPMRMLEHRIYAAQLTRCIRNLCEYPAMVIRYEFLAHSIVCAIRVHARYIEHPDPIVSQQSWYYFKQCVDLLRKFQDIAVIPECSAILQHIPTIYQYSSDYQQHQIDQQQQGHAHSGTNPCEFFGSLGDEHNSPMVADPNPFLITPSSNSMTVPSLMMSSNYTSLTGFGDHIGVDFGDRQQLWEQSMQYNSANTTSSSSASSITYTEPQADFNTSSNAPVPPPPPLGDFTLSFPQNDHTNNSDNNATRPTMPYSPYSDLTPYPSFDNHSISRYPQTAFYPN